MLQNQNASKANRSIGLALAILVMINAQASDFNNPPQRCVGLGDLQSFSLTNWEETGLEPWTVTHEATSSDDFETPDWAVVGSLPDGRSGKAAFVANLELSSFCENLVQMGVLRLDSPPIEIPEGVVVPRISIDHWFLTEKDWDGGNFKISVNGDPFKLIPTSAIEYGPYAGTLNPAVTGEGAEWNLNPLAGQDAFTGPNEEEPFLPSGWGQSHINLQLLQPPATAGDTVELRFDFGIDECTGGEVLFGNDYDWGWYVDEVEFYSCSAEVLPSYTTLTLVKTVTNDNGGTLAASDFPSFVNGVSQAWDVVAPHAANVVLTASETPQPGYTSGVWGGDCAADGTITLSPGEHAICTITNDDVAPTLTLVKTVTNDDGGDRVPSSFQLRLDGGTYVNAPFFSDDIPSVDANQAYTVSEDPLTGYTLGTIICLDDETDADLGNPVTLDPGQSATCTVSNDDDPPQLTVIKSVINDDGGSLIESEFTLHLTGDDGQSGTCGQDGLADWNSGDTPTPVEANCRYTLREEPVDGYKLVGIECTDDSTEGVVVGHPVTLTEGQFVTCTITNDDIDPLEIIFKDGFE